MLRPILKQLDSCMKATLVTFNTRLHVQGDFMKRKIKGDGDDEEEQEEEEEEPDWWK